MIELTSSGQQMLVVEAHPVTKKPFLCVRGVREYHDHPQHSGDAWCLYRRSINVYAILDRVLDAVGRSQPVVVLSTGLGWQIGLP